MTRNDAGSRQLMRISDATAPRIQEGGPRITGKYHLTLASAAEYTFPNLLRPGKLRRSAHVGRVAARVLFLALGLALVGAPGRATAWNMGPPPGKPPKPNKPVTVHPGESIQAAVDAASPGDTIYVLPGDYTESPSNTVAVTINKPLSLIAKNKPGHGHGWNPGHGLFGRDEKPSSSGRVRILAAAGQSRGIYAAPATATDPPIDGLVIQGFTVENFTTFGIFLKSVNNFRLEDNVSANNLENGIFPVLSTNGLVKRNVSYGAQDSALWVEASQNVRVVDNDLSGSPTGFEITISNEVTAEGNHIHDNTVGVGLYGPPTAGLPPAQWPSYWNDGGWHVYGNYVHDNNAMNTATGGMAAEIPQGSGILVLGTHDVDVKWNWIANNDFFGIGVVNYCVAVYGTPFNCTAHPFPPPADPKPENNVVVGNLLINNHSAPPAGPFQSFAADIVELVDFIDTIAPGTSPTTNCFAHNTIWNKPPLTPLTIPDPLPACATN